MGNQRALQRTQETDLGRGNFVKYGATYGIRDKENEKHNLTTVAVTSFREASLFVDLE